MRYLKLKRGKKFKYVSKDLICNKKNDGTIIDSDNKIQRDEQFEGKDYCDFSQTYFSS